VSFRYEHRSERPISRGLFVRRLLAHMGVALGLLAGSIALGMAGYMYWEHLSAIDAFLNTTMLLGGMGPVDPPCTKGGKLFAGLFALYAGLGFLIAAGLLFAPVLHRVLHKFHWEGR
jgi:hypothetical protein